MRRIALLKSALVSAAVLAMALPALPALAREAKAPATASAAKVKETGMVAAAHPLAVEAGVSVLRRGGSAVDAAVAVQAALGLVEPQSSGIGGGSFMTYYDAKTRKVTAYNGRETAPAGARPDMFLGPDGKPLPFFDAVTSGRATGVPGAVAMLHMAQKDHGRLAWKDLFTEAETLADQGFAVTPRLAALAASKAPQARQPDAVAYFTKADGQLIQAGDILKNPAYAATLRKIAAEGPAALLEGEIAEAIVRRTTEGSLPGTLTLADLKAYKPKVSEAVCRPYRVYVVCVPPAPSGGPAVLMGLGILSNTDIAAHGPDTVQGWYLFSQASRLMYADRDRYFGDPDFVDVPVQGLLDPAYLKARAALIPPQVAGAPPPPGKPKGAGARAPDATQEPGGTTHFVIVDGEGNVVSMTTTVESLFGSGRMVHGFFLNNQLTDFSFSPTEKDGVAAANAVAPGKRPRSSMAPAVVLDRKGRFYAAVGSPGGNSILAYNLKALVGVLDWKLPMQEAVALPNLIARGAPYLSEPAKFAPGVVEGLAARGVVLTGSGGAEGSGLHGVMVTPQGLSGGADPRREGVARKP
ncbi:MAG: gamma-glutamyltransferase [Pseudomonadota bacterium]|jgi:gamma-glutamyltranspeptidase/glutathione hydrolase